MEDGRISYISELSTKGFAEGANEIQRHVRKMSDEVERSSSKMDAALDKIGTRVKQAFAVGSFVEFGKKIVEVRGEMESLQKTFESLAGEQVGRKLYEDIKEFAVTTPMMAKDLAKGAQTLLGFNIAAEKVMPILRQIGDISMGDAQKFNSLTLAFAQMSSTGKLMGQDLLQMINAGFNPLVQISEKTGKSVAKLKDEMSKGAISVEMVEEAFRDATAEGGKFHNMLETQSKTMKGALSNLKGAYEDMLNEIGGKQQGLMLDTVNLAQTLIQNYEKVGQVVLGLVSTYGIYKAAVMAVTVAEGISTGSIILKTRALRAAAAAQALLNKTMLANPYVAAAAALGVLVGAVIASRDGLTDAERAQRDYNKTLEEAKNKQKEYNDETQNAINIARDDSAATEDREVAMRILINRYPDIIKKYIDEKGHLTDILNLKREIAAYDGLRANEDNRVNAELYRKYINVLNKAKSGKQLNDTEKILYEGAQKKYNDATPWYNRFTGNWTENATSYFKNLENQATYAYGRGKTQAKMNSFLEKLGEMETKDLQALQKTISTATKQVEGHKAKFIEEVGDYLERTDLDAIATKIDGIITARNKPKEETKDKKKPKTDHTAEQEATRRQKLFEQDMAAEESQSRQKRELRDALSELEIASEEDNAKRELMQMKKDHEDKLEAIREQADQWKKEAYKAAEERWNATNKNKTKTFADTAEGKAGWQAQSLTPEQEQTIQARVDAENAIYNRGVKERLEVEKQHMLDYLKEYGSISQKKQAIAAEYDKKIAETQDKWLKKSLEQERKKALNAIDVEVLKTKIDWTTMFDGVGKALEAEMKSTIKNIEEYMKTSEFKTSSFEEKTSLVNLRNKLIQQTSGGIGTFDFSIYGKIAEDTEAYQKAMLAHKIAIENQILAEEELTAAKKELEDAERELANAEGDDAKKVKAGERIKAAQNAISAAQNQVDVTQGQVQDSETQVANAQGDLITSTTQAQQAIDGFSNAMSEMTNGTLHGFANGLVKLIQAITGSEQSGLSGLGKAGGLIGAILSIIDALGEDPGGRIADIIDKIFNVFTGITEQVGSGQFLGKIVKSILEGIGKLISKIFENTWKDTERAFTFDGPYGGLSDSLLGIFGLAEEDEDLKRKRERLSDSLDSSAYAVDHFTKELDKATGVMAMTFGDELRETILKQMGVIVQGIDATLWDDYGGHHSDYYHFNNNQDMFYAMMPYMNRHGVNAYEEGQGHYTWQEIMRNNPEQLAAMFKDIQAHDPDLWNKITKEAGYNDGNLEEWLDKLIEAYDKLGEAADRTNEKLTSISYDSLESDFLNSLYDMADGSEDVFDDIEKRYQKMLNRMIVDNLVFGEDFQTKLKKWYEDLAQLQRERNGTADDFDQEAYEAERQRILDEIERLRNDDQKGKYIYDSPTPGSEYNREEIEALLAQLAELDRKAKEAQTGTQISDEEYQRRLEELKAQYQQWVAEGKDSVEFFREMGLIQAIDEAAEHFGDLRSKFLDTLMDMQFDAEGWKKELNKKLVQDLLEKQYFDVKMTVNGKEFDNFDAYAKDWSKRYLEALEAGDEVALQALIDELVQQRELIAKASEDLTSRLKEMQTDTTFKDMSDSWVSTLMDMSATAEDWAQNIGQIMVQKIVEQLIAPSLLQPLLDGLQGAFNTAMSADGATWDSVVSDAGVQEWLAKIRETFPEAQNVVRQIMESLGLITSDGLGNIKDDFVSALTDINKTAEDLGKDIANTMYSQMVDKFVDSKYGEELKSLSDEWAEALKLGDTAKIEELRQKIIALYETIGNDESIKELLDDIYKLNEEADSTPFDNLRSSYLSALMDMSKQTKDWTKEISQMIAESFVDEFVMGEAFNDKLEQWKKQYKEITEDSNLSEEQRMRQLKALSELIAADTESGKQQVNDILKWLGIRDGQDQSATMNMAEAATYDQFELYLGMETSHLMVAEQTKSIAQQILTTLQGMNSITSPGTNYGEQIFMRLGTTNEYLLAVKRATEAIRSEFAAKLDIMNSHLSKL